MSDDKYTVHSNGSLSILDAEKEDEGAYRVEISNYAGSASEQIEVELIQRTRKLLFSDTFSNLSVHITAYIFSYSYFQFI